MRDRFLFFDFKRNGLINLLIVFQVALWLFYVASLISLLKFDTSYRNRYSRSLPLDNGQLLVFYKMIAKSSSEEDYSRNLVEINNATKYLETNNYKYGIIRRESKEYIPLDVLDLSLKDIKPNFNRTKERYKDIYPIYMNYDMIHNYKNNIDMELSKEDWNYNNEGIPVILGSSFSKKFKVGSSFKYKDKNYIIKGFFKKDTLAFDYADTVDSSFLLNDSFVIPLEKNQYTEDFNFEPISIYLDESQKNNVDKLQKDIEKISSNIVINDFKEDLNTFLEELKSKRIFETVRILIVSLIATASIATTIIYKILRDKDRIGILFSIGISKNKIFRILSLEFLIYVLSGIVAGSLFYIKNCRNVYVFFINEGMILNLYIGMFIIIVIVFLVLLLGFKIINRLSPKEMVGGFKE